MGAALRELDELCAQLSLEWCSKRRAFVTSDGDIIPLAVARAIRDRTALTSSSAKLGGEGQRLSEHIAQFGGATSLEQNLAAENEALAQSNRRLREGLEEAVRVTAFTSEKNSSLKKLRDGWIAALKDNGHG